MLGPFFGFLVLSLLLGFYLLSQEKVGPAGFVGVLLGGGLLGILLGLAMYGAIGAAAGGLIRMLTGAGNLTPAPSFSYQESLVMQGKHQEAADAYRSHLATHPADHDARLALAALLAGPMTLTADAEREYLAVRTGSASRKQELVASQALIDLYAATAQRGKHMAELARFAERYRGTVDGNAARRALAELKQADRPTD
ncbi:MAG TPA: hypothetical protein VJU15_06785 [Gemmatimonadales bacterium]|nr:hypothetical protein [Gemmatimonadales bacterium]